MGSLQVYMKANYISSTRVILGRVSRRYIPRGLKLIDP
jgi:hypothetical protein